LKSEPRGRIEVPLAIVDEEYAMRFCADHVDKLAVDSRLGLASTEIAADHPRRDEIFELEVLTKPPRPFADVIGNAGHSQAARGASGQEFLHARDETMR